MIKGGGSVSAPTIDPTQAINQFHMSADTIAAYSPGALNQYLFSLGEGTRSALDSFLTAQQASMPYSQTARTAMDELRGFMGLAPISDVPQISAELRTAAQKWDTPGVSNIARTGPQRELLGFADRIDRIEGISDTTERQAALTEVLSDLNQFKTDIYQDSITANNVRRTRGLVGDDPAARAKGLVISDAGVIGVKGGSMTTPGNVLLDQGVGEFLGGKSDEELRQLAASKTGVAFEEIDPALRGKYQGVTGLEDQVQNQYLTHNEFFEVSELLGDITNTISKVESDLSKNYKIEKPTAPTGMEIQQKLEELPEYQFQFSQGQKALERSQAARGELQSGRALQEATQFGQNLAQNVYQGHLQQLAGLAGINMPVVQQNIGQTPGFGQFSAGQSALGGQAAQQSTMGTANARANAFNQAGQTMFQAAQQNAQMQMQASLANQQASQGGFLGNLSSSFGGGLAKGVLGEIF